VTDENNMAGRREPSGGRDARPWDEKPERTTIPPAGAAPAIGDQANRGVRARLRRQARGARLRYQENAFER